MLNIAQMDEQSFWQKHCEYVTSPHNVAKKDKVTNITEYLYNNLSEESTSPLAIRFVPTFHRDLEYWKTAARRVFFALETKQELYNLAPVHYRQEFGNVFIFFMEYFCRLITDNIDSILYSNHSLNEAKNQIEQLSNLRCEYRINYECLINKISDLSTIICKQETLLNKRLDNLRTWANIADVKHDSEIFFSAYTLGYFGNTLKLDEM